MSRQTYKNGWRGYVCGKKSRGEWKSCPSQMVNARNAEIVVLHTILNRILTPEYFSVMLTKVQERFLNNEKIDKQIKELTAKLARAKRAISNLLDALETQGFHSIDARLKEREVEKETLLAKLNFLKNQKEASSLKVSPEAIQLVVNNWRDQIIRDLQSQDIQTVRLLIKQFVTRIEVNYEHIRLYYRYPLGNNFPGSSQSTLTLDSEFIEGKASDMTKDCVQSIFDIAPHLAPVARTPREQKPITSRDLEIYRLHTEEEQTIVSLAKQFGLSEKSIWGICTRTRKRLVNQKIGE